jgi:hypothetical protein
MIGRLKDEKGQALTEFTLILPILLLLVMATIQFGLALNSYLVLTGLARDAARVGSITNDDYEIYKVLSENNPTLDTDELTVIISPPEWQRSRGGRLNVTLEYPIPIIVPFFDSISKDGWTLQSSITMRVE